MSEVQNVVEDSGQTLSAADLNQLGKAIADYVGNGDFYTDSGAADAYVLTVIGSKQSPTAYTDGMNIAFSIGNTNTGASTVNVAGLGVKNLSGSSGSALSAGDLTSGDVMNFRYDDGSGEFRLSPFVRSVDVESALSVNNFLHVRDEKGTTVAGGGSISGFNKRDLNTVLTNTISGASLASSVITLPAGDYYAEAMAPVFSSDTHDLKLQNDTDVTDLVYGKTQHASSANGVSNSATLSGSFTLAGTKDISLQHYISNAQSVNGLGFAARVSGSLPPSVFSEVKIWKVG